MARHSALRRTQTATLLTSLLLLLLASGCGESQRNAGRSLADAGASTAANLAAYYDILAGDCYDILEYEAFLSSIRGIKSSEDPKTSAEDPTANLMDTAAALRSRARLARQLGTTFVALKALADYDASVEVRTSVLELSDAINGLVQLPTPKGTTKPAIPSDIFGNVARELANLEQTRELRKGTKAALEALDKLRDLYQKELPACQGVAKERALKVGAVLAYLIEQKLIRTAPLLSALPKEQGTDWVDEKKPPEDPKTVSAIIAMCSARQERVKLTLDTVGEKNKTALSELSIQCHGFLQKGVLDLKSLAEVLESTKTYLAEVKKYRTALEKSRDAKEEKK